MKDILDDTFEEFDDPENYCTVCGDLIEVKSGLVPVEGEEYYIVRQNREDKGYVMTEKHIHGDCLQQYLEESEED